MILLGTWYIGAGIQIIHRVSTRRPRGFYRNNCINTENTWVFTFYTTQVVSHVREFWDRFPTRVNKVRLPRSCALDKLQTFHNTQAAQVVNSGLSNSPFYRASLELTCYVLETRDLYSTKRPHRTVVGSPAALQLTLLGYVLASTYLILHGSTVPNMSTCVSFVGFVACDKGNRRTKYGLKDSQAFTVLFLKKNRGATSQPVYFLRYRSFC